MFDYNTIMKATKEVAAKEKKLSFDLGAPWVYCDDSHKHIIYEYKNGAKEIKDMNGKTIEIIQPEKGI